MKLIRSQYYVVACHKREFIAIMGGTRADSLISIFEIENTVLRFRNGI